VRIKSLTLGLSAGVITAIGFGICGVFFAIAPGPTSAFLSWVLHLDVTGMTRPLSVSNLLAGIVLFGAYVGLAVGLTAALYNRLATPRTT
jgi:2TM family of unknown function (DUF5676)